MKHLKTFFVLANAALVASCGGSRIPTEVSPEPPRLAESAEATLRPGCIDFDHPEASIHPNLVMMVKSRLETERARRCFWVHSFVEAGVATAEGFVPLAVLIERRE